MFLIIVLSLTDYKLHVGIIFKILKRKIIDIILIKTQIFKFNFNLVKKILNNCLYLILFTT